MALNAYKKGQLKTKKEAAALAFDIPQSTLQCRIERTISRLKRSRIAENYEYTRRQPHLLHPIVISQSLYIYELEKQKQLIESLRRVVYPSTVN